MSSLEGSHNVWSSFLNFFKTNCFERWLSALGYTSEHFWLSLITLLTIDAMANPYAGIVHDARLYAVQALYHLHPGIYDKDLFFQYGSQDSFSIFSIIHAQIVAFCGLQCGTSVLYILFRFLFLGSLLVFFRNFLNNNKQAFFVTCLLAAGQVHYIFFDVNEPFLTSRLPSEAFCLLGLAAALHNSHKICIAFLLVAGLFHPLIVLGPGAIILAFWIRQRHWEAIAIMAASAFLGLMLIFVLQPKAVLGINPFALLDNNWREVISSRSSYLFPFEWPSDEWKTIFGNLLLVGLGLKSLSKRQKEFTICVALVVTFFILFSILVTYILPLALPFQLQLWRSFWLLRILSPDIALLWALALWNQKDFSKKMAAPIVLVPVVLSGGISSSEIYWIILAGLLSSLPLRILDNRLSERLRKYILAIEITLLFILPIPIAIINLQTFFESLGLRSMILSFVSAVSPLFRPISLLIFVVLIGKLKNRLAFCLLISFLIFLFVPGVLPSSGYPTIIELERSFNKNRPIPSTVLEWQEIIPAGSMILTDGSVPVNTIWFNFNACSYYSQMQGAGMIFNRKIALEYSKRRMEVEEVFKGNNVKDLSLWCKKRNIDYVISKKILPLRKIGEHKCISLYYEKHEELNVSS